MVFRLVFHKERWYAKYPLERSLLFRG